MAAGSSTVAISSIRPAQLRAHARGTAPPRHAWTVVPSGREAPVKGGKTRDIPLPAVVTQFLQRHIDWVVATKVGTLTHDTPLFWSEWGCRHCGSGSWSGQCQSPRDYVTTTTRGAGGAGGC